ncbi:hypothetical protein EYF80_063606 [Liparis tanakae]|uniref:Uncharacterized protein n=1 Tax=Liparis tanakae TaxID=230148 RepID=A0A4Z2EBJ5_9TELE|nr:hypothetical protein EYF80_063606 [Liparis tanakae]
MVICWKARMNSLTQMRPTAWYHTRYWSGPCIWYSTTPVELFFTGVPEEERSCDPTSWSARQNPKRISVFGTRRQEGAAALGGRRPSPEIPRESSTVTQ